jgi:hypothetical protein
MSVLTNDSAESCMTELLHNFNVETAKELAEKINHLKDVIILLITDEEELQIADLRKCYLDLVRLSDAFAKSDYHCQVIETKHLP